VAEADRRVHELVELFGRLADARGERVEPSGNLVPGCASCAHDRGGVEGEQSLGHGDGGRAVVLHHHREDRYLRGAASHSGIPAAHRRFSTCISSSANDSVMAAC
jgi:hypothetical protein